SRASPASFRRRASASRSLRGLEVVEVVEDVIGLDAPVCALAVAPAALLSEDAGLDEIRHPGLARRGSVRAPRFETRLPHGRRRLPHLFGAAAAGGNDALEEVRGMPFPVEAGGRLAQPREH